MLTQTLDLATIVLIDYILLIRVLALFHEDRKLSIILKILLGLEAGLDLGILIHESLSVDTNVGSVAEGMIICIRIGEPSRTLVIVSWLAPATYGFVLMCLALYKSAEYWKLSSGFKGFRLVRVLVQDQALYFGFVIFCFICKIIVFCIKEITPFVSTTLGSAGSPTLLCVLGSHLLINLKEAGERGANGGTNYTPRTVSEIDFGEECSNDERISTQRDSV
ncbi:hypothetical protein A7U60_g7993 [Sanghuangporus baumii]|uniref:Uncharacterized protein n=1 Tax=Sanghuangporus baumii TaxID=108892 RepID=A0A9Q5N4B4_SANBA|nr:hypothetical protein A7U60_g7993 [Sanghuangporus baumii]